MNEGLVKEWMRGPQWVSAAAEAEWGPVIRAAARAWEELEVLSVTAGVRSSALVYLTPEELVTATRDCATQGLLVVPLSYDGSKVRSAVTHPDKFGSWLEAWRLSDDDQIGELLGFPQCCRDHFAETWGRGMTDTVVHMRLASDGGDRSASGPAEANLLLRHLGVRLVPHLPCSPSCAETLDLGQAFARAAREGGVDTTPIYRLLELPVAYDTLNGVAITETPHFRFQSGTEVREETRVTYAPTRPTPEDVRAAGRYYVPPPAPPDPSADESAADNGFTTGAGMNAAHDVVLRAVGHVASAVDLGCGDGRLLDRIRRESRELNGRNNWVGYEMMAYRVAHGLERHPEVTLHVDNVEDVPDQPVDVQRDVVLIMPGRLLEMTEEDAARVRQALPLLGHRIVAYAYGDQLAAEGGLSNLCRKAGLRHLPGTWHQEDGVAAALDVEVWR